MTVLRAEARKSGVYLRVLKNTLVRRAVAVSYTHLDVYKRQGLALVQRRLADKPQEDSE